MNVSKHLLGIVFFIGTTAARSQNINVRDTLPPAIDWKYAATASHPFPYTSFIIPATLIAYGYASFHSSHLEQLDLKVKEEVWTEDPHKKIGLDTYMMFVPALAVYGLNAAGIQGEHNFRDRTMILLMSNLIAQGAVFSLKGSTHQLRPDGSDYYAFPSGHTAEAFVSAEFLREEYKDVSPWYGIAGYAVATATGFLRVYNNKHWLSDVVAGAGIGMASTRLSYWLYPKIQHIIFKDRHPNTALMPTYQNGSAGLAFVHLF